MERRDSPVRGELLGKRMGSSCTADLLRIHEETGEETGALLPDPDELAVSESKLLDGATTSTVENVELAGQLLLQRWVPSFVTDPLVMSV